MAAPAGILNFVRGLDLSSNPLDDDFGNRLKNLSNLYWVKLNKTGLVHVPPTVTSIPKLEAISVSRNNLKALSSDLAELKHLGSIIARRNQINMRGLPGAVFLLEDLNTVDLGWNDLSDLPIDALEARALKVLALAHNRLKAIPSQLLINSPDIQFLDVSNNMIDSIPPQLRRLAHLESLNLAHNPLEHVSLRPLCALNTLQILNLSSTQRTVSNIPDVLDQLSNLTELDLSYNTLPTIPIVLYNLASLRRLNLSNNGLTEVLPLIGQLENLETLNLSTNKLSSIPDTIFDIRTLRRLYVDRNNLRTVPDKFDQCTELELFYAAHNHLTAIPVSICSCTKLRRLKLNDNKISSVPVQIYQLEPHLKLFAVEDNPDFEMPPRPKGFTVNDLYNIDFDAQAAAAQGQLGTSILASRDISVQATEVKTANVKHTGAGLIKGREADTVKVLMGMAKVSNDKGKSALASAHTAPETEDDKPVETRKPKRWDEQIDRPQLDYSEIFGDAVGKQEGVTVWRIENFLPIEGEPELNGKFYEADCYIVLKSTTNEQNGGLDYAIWFWIGEKSSLDKKASAAIHAVNLRNYLEAKTMVSREEQNDESGEFLHLFNNEIAYIEGGTESGFFIVEQTEYVTRLFRVWGEKETHAEPSPLLPTSLHTKLVFLLDMGLKMYVWAGVDSKLTQRSKARLLAERLNKNERGNRAQIVQVSQGDEPDEFWALLHGQQVLPDRGHTNGSQRGHHAAGDLPVLAAVTSDPAKAEFPFRRPCLYKVALGKGFLELPQVDTFSSGGNLLQSMLESTHVYILDSHVDVFIWIGRKSSRLVRAAAMKLSDELMHILPRPAHAIAIKVLELAETQFFKLHFQGWDDAIAVDFSAQNIMPPVLTVKQKQERVKATIERPEVKYTPPKVDIRALFTARPNHLADEQAEDFMADANDRLEKMECFVLEGRKFVRLPKKEVGQFYDHDCYVFLCTYWKDKDYVFHDSNENDVDTVKRPGEKDAAAADGSDDEAEGKGKGKGKASSDDEENGEEGEGDDDDDQDEEEEEEEEEEEDEIECVVYFWQGRFANKMGWLTFTFSFQKEIEKLVDTNFGCSLRVLRSFQQRESMTFLSHFGGRFVIHHGQRPTKAESAALAAITGTTKGSPAKQAASSKLAATSMAVMLYHIRQNSSRITMRTICERPHASSLCSQHCYVLKVPFDNVKSGIVYVWIGKHASAVDAKLADTIGHLIKGDLPYSLQTIMEGNEPENFFWVGLGGKAAYDADADYIGKARLFQCTNADGYFAILEKNPDFCQDDLADEDVMILDTSKDVFLWFGAHASEAEKKLAIKSAQVYLERNGDGRTVKNLKIAKRGREPHAFTRCFHGWDDTPRERESL